MAEDVVELTCSSTKKRNGRFSYPRTDNVDHTLWLPKSQIEFYPADDLMEIRMPGTLAEKHGLM
jgi:hypothetical protein